MPCCAMSRVPSTARSSASVTQRSWRHCSSRPGVRVRRAFTLLTQPLTTGEALRSLRRERVEYQADATQRCEAPAAIAITSSDHRRGTASVCHECARVEMSPRV